jgi:ribokinase
MSQFDVIGFGALNVDRLYKVDKLANAEEESFIETYTEVCGGSAANTTVGLARLGCKVGFIGKVGCDRESKMILQDLCIEGVDTKGIIQADQGKSGSVLGFVDKNGERALYVDPGVNDTITYNEIDQEYVSKTKYLHLSSFVGNQSFEAQKKLLEIISDSTKVTFDPGILYASKGYDVMEPIIQKTNVLIPNSIELKLLTGKTNYHEGADFMIQQGIEIVAVKLGSAGSYVTNGTESYDVKPFNVDVMDTTGAGDAFCAGFISGLLNEESLLDCARLGNFVASRKVMKLGARAGLPYTKDLDFLD